MVTVYKLKIHSFVDLITNSSTTIFTNSHKSLNAVKELIDESLKLFGIDKKFDDLFYANVFCENEYPYFEYYNCPSELADSFEKFEQFKLDILTKKNRQTKMDEIR